jgi:hypothetical protein
MGTIKTCDRCKRNQIDYPDIDVRSFEAIKYPTAIVSTIEKELCTDCVDDILHFINSNGKIKEVEKTYKIKFKLFGKTIFIGE